MGGEHSPLFDIGNKHCDPKLVFSTFVLTVSDSAKKVWKAGSVKQNVSDVIGIWLGSHISISGSAFFRRMKFATWNELWFVFFRMGILFDY